uniref:ribonuclease H n=1 Tax=Leptobrachium leishanense TaxID=445787 RepID=A0A8C5LM99_9ANUR
MPAGREGGDTRKATLRPLPIVGEPFRRVAVDLIGPLAVPSTTGKKYILTVVDYATRYPEAVALRDIHAETVAGALLQIFSRVGFPQEILSDQGTQFTAEVTQQLWRLCGIKPLYSSPYHPQTNGLCERFNGTLKQLLCTFTMSHKGWERHLPHLLFAYREVPQEATGFSPFELLYGRRVRGPLDLLREHWEGALAEEGTSAIDYVLEFRDRLQELTALVRDNLKAAQTKQKRWYDRSARDRTFQLLQKVLALRPVKQNKLQAAWEGPYKIIEKICDTTFIAARCSDERIYVNMLKPFHEREEAVAAICAPDAGDLEDLPLPVLPGDPSAQGIADVRLSKGLSPRHREQAQQVLWEHRDLFSSRPGYTSVALHRVDTQSQTPLRQTAYRIPDAVRDGMQKEIREMLDLGVIEPSESPWASPVVLVPKKDGTTRFCVDYRRLNEHTVTDAYPMPWVDELLDRIAQGHFLTTIDLCKGYWQIPLAEEGVPKSAFITPFGLYQFWVMPFGMKNAPATFQRIVDHLLEGMQDFTSAYLDDIAIFSNTWEDHLQHLRAVLDRLGPAGLTVKPDKCHVGMSEVQYLGHRVGGGRQRPEPAKVEAVAQWPTPRTKTQVLAFLGTAGYYRRFVPNYSAIAKPLT